MPECFRDEFLKINRYTSLRLLYFYFTNLYQVVDNDKWNGDGKEYRRGVADDDQDGEDVKERQQPDSSYVRQHSVDGLDVPRESVQDATGRRRVEEHHRSSQDVGQHPRVKDARRMNAHQSKEQREDHDEHSCDKCRSTVVRTTRYQYQVLSSS